MACEVASSPFTKVLILGHPQICALVGRWQQPAEIPRAPVQIVLWKRQPKPVSGFILVETEEMLWPDLSTCLHQKNSSLIHCPKPVWWLLQGVGKMQHCLRAPIASSATFREGERLIKFSWFLSKSDCEAMPGSWLSIQEQLFC